jgi:aspartyl-tRNA(Asn)/glutamyl-tRNA(Gln) amidotransferase subunit A
MGAARNRAGLPKAPLGGIAIAEFARRLRRGEMTIEATVRDYLARIDTLDLRLGAFEFVAADSALKSASALDRLLAAGCDLGPLMGVPIGIKDLFAVNGMPVTAGSQMDITDLVGEEGSFVKLLRKAGCVILGKTKTVEFAYGAAGTNTVRGTPWNPWDSRIHRAPGGSSSGSAVAVAAGLCAFAIGSDTGGSVRLPAALCGLFGLKTTVGLWPTDGVFPLSPTLDSIGLLTRSAADGALAFAALTGRPVPAAASLRALRLGKPVEYFFDDLDPAVAQCTNAALALLKESGAEISDVKVSNFRERETLFPILLSSELIATLGRERFEVGRHLMDPVVAARAARGLQVAASDYVGKLRRHQELKRTAFAEMSGLDAWVTPTAALLPIPISEFAGVDRGLQMTAAMSRNSQPMNMFGQCGTTTPIHALGAPLPVGLQLSCRPFEEDATLAIALAFEERMGVPAAPDLSGFL